MRTNTRPRCGLRGIEVVALQTLLVLLASMAVVLLAEFARTGYVPFISPAHRQLITIQVFASAATSGDAHIMTTLLGATNPGVGPAQVLHQTARQRAAGYLDTYTVEAIEQSDGVLYATIRWTAPGKPDTCLRIRVAGATTVTLPSAYERCSPSLQGVR
jgi:hypothetical protein